LLKWQHLLCSVTLPSIHHDAAFQGPITGLYYYVFSCQETIDMQSGLMTSEFTLHDKQDNLDAIFCPKDTNTQNLTIEYGGHVNMGEFSLRCAAGF
jgi:hypothetical protein